MSFSAKVKGEICRYTDISKEEALAELSAIMKGSGTIGFSGKGLSFRITTENPASARHIFTILKEHFDIHSKLMVKKSNSLKKNNIYMVLIDEEMGVKRNNVCHSHERCQTCHYLSLNRSFVFTEFENLF